MIILDSTTESLEILLGGAVATNQLPFTVSFADHNAAAPSFTPGSTDGQTNGATAVTLVASPAASVQRQVKRINIYNADTATALLQRCYVLSETDRPPTSPEMSEVKKEGIGLQRSYRPNAATENASDAPARVAVRGRHISLSHTRLPAGGRGRRCPWCSR